MPTFSASYSAIETPYPTAGTGANPLFESIVGGGHVRDPSFPLEEWPGAQPHAKEFAINPFPDADLFLSLYDLCHGDIALLDAIRGPERTPPLAPTPPPIPAVSAPQTICNAPGPSSVSSSAVAHTPLQGAKASTFLSSARYMPYSRAGMKRHDQSQLSKKDYIRHHGVTSIRPLDGLETMDLNSTQAHGQWRVLLVDTLEQIGLPYSIYGLKLLVAKAYGLKSIRGQKKHPENRWQNHMSYHFCQYKKKAGASSQEADASAPLFVKLENELYSSTYWWLAGRPVPRQCEGFPEEAYKINQYMTTETPPDFD